LFLRSFVVQFSKMKPLADCQLYTFVDTACLRGRAPELVAQQLCDGGSDLVQLRAKNAPPDEIRAMAEKILPITRLAGARLVINDHLAIAQAVGAEFCHLGQEDFFGAGHQHVSEILNPDSEAQTPESEFRTPRSALRIGLSTHAPAQAQRALAAGADYVAIGPVYATATKPNTRPVTLGYVRWAAAQVTEPWFAIGGINLRTLDEVLAAGARRVCVVSAILDAPDVAKACAEFKRRLA
jgi:thiamine-phosphate pyrophosphorylase